MTEATESTKKPRPSNAGHDTEAESRRWRDDPLSVFLAIAALLLGGMYLLEQRDAQVLDGASARAKELGATSLDLPGCTVGAAGANGTTLVVVCDDVALTAVSSAAELRPDLTGFDEVTFVGSDAQRVCSADPTTWPDGCVERPLATTPPR